MMRFMLDSTASTNSCHPTPRRRRNQRLVAAVLTASLTGLVAGCGGPAKPVGVVGHVQGFAGMTAADEPRAALVGQEVLSAGGSVADAAVAMAFTLSVTLPSQVGPGAGGSCLIYDHDKKTSEVLDFQGASAGTMAAPALPRGLYALQAKYGKLRWESLLGAAEGLARQGTSVSRAFARQLTSEAPALGGSDSLRQIFSRDGRWLSEGDVMTRLDLATVLGRLRTRGVGDFYNGTWSAELISATRAQQITADDQIWRQVQPRWTPAQTVTLGNDTALLPNDGATGTRMASLLKAQASGQKLTAEQLSGLLPPRMASTTPNGTGLVAMSKDGSAVACSLSLNQPFGLRQTIAETGMIPAAPPQPGVTPALLLVINTNSNEFRFAGASGADGSAALLGIAVASQLGNKPLPKATALLAEGAMGNGLINALRCPSGSPDSSRCEMATDPRGAGLATTLGAEGGFWR